jgi:hypothetical protein
MLPSVSIAKRKRVIGISPSPTSIISIQSYAKNNTLLFCYPDAGGVSSSTSHHFKTNHTEMLPSVSIANAIE